MGRHVPRLDADRRPIAGLVSQHLGARAGLALGAVACIAAAGLGAVVVRRTGPRTTPAQG